MTAEAIIFGEQGLEVRHVALPSQWRATELRWSEELTATRHPFGPCRGFTPKLAEWYKANAEKLDMDIVFVSSDKDQGAFDEYYGEMTFYALPFSASGVKEALKTFTKEIYDKGQVPTVS